MYSKRCSEYPMDIHDMFKKTMRISGEEESFRYKAGLSDCNWTRIT